jgi:hypothetical protein
MQRARGSVWFAVIGGMLAWSLRTIPPSPPVSGAAVAAVAEAPLPLANRLRPQPVDFSPDLRGRPTERGLTLDLLASSQATPASDKRLVIEPAQPVTHAWSVAGALPYFPTGPPPIA